MASAVMKVEVEAEACCLCGASGCELLTPEEHDAAAPPGQTPLRAMLLHLNHNRAVPEGRLCARCCARAGDAHALSAALAARAAPAPLSDKIRALRRRLHELTQKIDVFIVVGGPGSAGGGRAYSEDDIIMVERDALAAAAAADDEDLEHARNAKGDSVYQCSVCPLSFQRVSEYRAHCATHPGDARHSCWTCGAQFAERAALRDHAAQHAALHLATCYLCDTSFQCQSELRRHEAACPSRCPACGVVAASRGELARHCAERHARGPAPLACPACFRTFGAPDLLSAHLLRHRQAKQFVCGYGDCVLRFGTRSNLMTHIRKCHAAELPPDAEAEGEAEAEPAAEGEAARAAPDTCEQCGRTFASPAALKRHARSHRAPAAAPAQPPQLYYEEQEVVCEEDGAEGMEYLVGDEGEGEVEYLEVETLEEAEYLGDEAEDHKPPLLLR